MEHLFEALAKKVNQWRSSGYHHEQYPAVAEILEWIRQPDVPTFRLRAPQIRALETYWYLRLVENTPHVFDLYNRLFTRTTERMAASLAGFLPTQSLRRRGLPGPLVWASKQDRNRHQT